MRKVFRKSKWIHKWIGLVLILFLIWMSASGILLNHPEWISDISVPARLLPPQYTPENWNRSALIDLVFSPQNPQVLYAAGKQGVWRSGDGGKTFRNFEQNFESSWYYKKTKDLYVSDGETPFLLAGTDGGLFVCNPETGAWRSVPLGEKRQAVRKIVTVGERLLVFSESAVFEAEQTFPDFRFRKIHWMKDEPQKRVSLVDLFFHLHDGRVWGLPGRLLFDLGGLVIIFLSISAFYIWYFPKYKRFRKKRGADITGYRKAKGYRFFLRYHLRLGIILAFILLIIAVTGFFMRPPLLALIAEDSIPAKFYPGILPENPWHKKVHNALYDPVEGRIIVNCSDGNWSGPADFSEPFRRMDLNVPVFVMGATVFEAFGSGGYLVGSFNGMFHLERSTGKAYDLIRSAYKNSWSNVRPDEFMVTGFFKSPGGEAFITTHEQGLLSLPGEKQAVPYEMPEELALTYEMPLWNVLFELHNGRLFKDLIGGFYILLVPLGALLFILIILSGIFDWTFLESRKWKTKKTGNKT